MATICLNSIVKNEGEVIIRMLSSVVDIIDTYCICDTGSTDDTIEKITDFFNSRNIQGKIITEPFVNFEHNRNVALNACYGMSDYVLLLDADMVLNVKNFNKTMLKDKEIYSILQGNDNFHYPNVRILKNDKLSKYIGVTHEYVDCPPYQTMVTFDKSILFITDIGDGGSKTDKSERDIRLLSGDLEKNENNPRTLFYLANTYFDINRLDEAIPFYEKRIKVGGWEQEIWYSNYRLGEIYNRKGDILKAIDYWLEAYEVNPLRLENILKIVNHYRCNGKPKRAYAYIKMVTDAILHHKEKSTRNDYLFMENSVYTHILDYEIIILSYYIGIKNVNSSILSVLQHTTDPNLISSVFANMKFYINTFPTLITRSYTSEITHNVSIAGKNVPLLFKSSSPCIIENPSGPGYLMNIRYHNYVITDTSYMIILPPDYEHDIKPTITLNQMVCLDENFDIISSRITKVVSPISKKLIGVEDVRLFYSEDEKSISYIGTSTHKIDDISIVTGKYDNNEMSPAIRCRQSFKQSHCEKNWVYFNHRGKKRVVYNWSPLTVCELNDKGDLNIVFQQNMPYMFNLLRGSTCGVTYKDELWFVCHAISFEGEHGMSRHYYDIIVVMDADSMKIKRTSPFFKYSTERIQYTLGLIVTDKTVILSYSIGDTSTNVSVYDKKVIEDSMTNYIFKIDK